MERLTLALGFSLQKLLCKDSCELLQACLKETEQELGSREMQKRNVLSTQAIRSTKEMFPPHFPCLHYYFSYTDLG